MGNPVNKFATCIYCAKRLRWDRPRLTEAQEIENKAIDDYNASLDFNERHLRKNHPHETPYRYDRWTHATEKPGEDKLYCEGQDEENGFRRNRAVPLEFCTEDIQSAGYYGDRTCNARAKERAEWEPYSHVPLCGRHLTPLKKEARRKEEQKEHYELQSWVKAEMKKVCDLLEASYGLEALAHYDRHTNQYTGKIVVDPKKLLDILKEEVL